MFSVKKRNVSLVHTILVNACNASAYWKSGTG